MGLPYDMGNAGDLVKHGLLAEFAQWWCTFERRELQFLDPFGGQPWTDSPRPEVSRRIAALPPCALRTVQDEPTKRYYGSSYVVQRATTTAGCHSDVQVSDSDAGARSAFQGHPFRPLASDGFTCSDGFSILDANVDASLLLLDPFADFLPRRAADVIPKIANVAHRIACVLFVLNLDPSNSVGRRYEQLRRRYLASAWRLHCPRLKNAGVVGESQYEVDVLLVWRPLPEHPGRVELRHALQAYANGLSKVLGAKVGFSDGDEHAPNNRMEPTART